MINHFGKYTIFLTEMGWMGLVSTGGGIFASVLPQESRNKAESKLLARVAFKPEFSHRSFKILEDSLKVYFKGAGGEIKCDIDWSWATPFQKRVLEIVRAIPRGSVMTYGDVAGSAGLAGGARAVGNALASNLIPVIIPCHRVIGKNGALGGFTGAGPEFKARLLFLEGLKVKELKVKGGMA